VYEFWNDNTCETQYTNKIEFSKESFEEIEKQRYQNDSSVSSFAQWHLSKGKKILEVGVGAGTDFIQFVKNGAEAYGIDLTPQSINYTKRRLEVYNLKAAISVADAENLPYNKDAFDLVYSYGVIHHSPDSKKALEEIVRVTKPGGICKIMVYNRHSLAGLYLWFVYALFKGKPNRSIYWAIFNHMESFGTKAYTKNEIKKMLSALAIENLSIKTTFQTHHKFKRFNKIIYAIVYLISCFPTSNNLGLQLQIQFNKKS